MTVHGELQGDFTLFGFSHEIVGMKRRVLQRLGVNVQTIAVGERGHFFYYTTYGDLAETDEAIVLKLGILRSKTKSALNARQLVEQKLAGPGTIYPEGFGGNGLVIGISKKNAVFAAFQTLMAVPQLYYSEIADGIICSDVLRCMLQVLPNCEMNEAILPQHFLFRSVYGSSTYFRGIERLIPGHYLRWVDGKIEIRLVRNMDVVKEEADYIQRDVKALNLLYEALEGVVNDYIKQIEVSGQKHANLLSGGVDSTLVQYFINSASSQTRNRSISYSIKVPAFEFEVEYAKQASKLLNTKHTFVEYSPQDYPGLLTRVIDILAQPPNLETEPSFLAVAEYIHAADWPERFFLTGQGGDTLFGGEAAIKLKGLESLHNVPGIVPFLNHLGKVFAPISNKAITLRKGAEIIASQNNPDAYINPSNSVCVYVLDENWDILHRSFGDRTLQDTLAFRRNLIGGYSKNQHYLEKVYFIDLLTDLWELGVERNHIFLAHNIEQASPFFDEDLLTMSLNVHPDLRYIKGFRYKHLLRRLLAQKTHAPVAHKRKGPSNVNDDLVAWMSTGPLRPLVNDIIRPDFMEKKDFERLIKKPDYFLWPLLTLDIFQKHVLGRKTN